MIFNVTKTDIQFVTQQMYLDMIDWFLIDVVQYLTRGLSISAKYLVMVYDSLF